MKEKVSGQENRGLMGGQVVIVDGEYSLQDCASKAPAKACTLYKNGFCGTITESVNLDGHLLHCGKVSKNSTGVKKD